MTTTRRSTIAGMTDYTGVPLGDIFSHIGDWRDETVHCVEELRRLDREVEAHQERLDWSDDIREYIAFFIDLLGRYVGDFDRLLRDMPLSVSDAHVEVIRQIYESSRHEEDRCVTFKREHIIRGLKDEKLRWLVDEIYSQSRGMLIDYRDLSNIVPRLRTFVGTVARDYREFEQKFRILYSPAQAQRDFDLWVAEADGITGYSIGVIIIDIDDFKHLNSTWTESVVDRAILAPVQQLIRGMSLQKGAAYRHGGEEFLVILPNCSLEETSAFAEKIRQSIEAQYFAIDTLSTARLTVSAGVAAWPTHGTTLDRVIEVANQAEHAAKVAGKNCVHTHPA
jgi:diguanylate cyclase (GGDEF)-like protein